MIDISTVYHPEDEEYLPFQQVGIVESLQRLNLIDGILIGDEMGCGKTIQSFGIINATFRQIEIDLGRHAKVLVCCPNNLRLNWLHEGEKWIDPAFGRDFEQCTSSAFFESDFMVASFEGMTKWHRQLAKMPWDIIIVDEAHGFKNRSAKRTQALYYLRNATPHGFSNGSAGDDKELTFEYTVPNTAAGLVAKTKRIMLTGTPIPNYPYELFPLIHWLDPQQWSSAAAFETRYYSKKGKYGLHMDELQKFLRSGKTVQVGTRENKYLKEEGERQFRCQVMSCGQRFDSEVDARRHAESNINHEVRSPIFTLRQTVDFERVLEQRPGVMIRRLKKEVLPDLPKKRRQIIELPAEGELLELVQEEKKLWEKHIRQVKVQRGGGFSEDAVALLLDENKSAEDISSTIFESEMSFDQIIEALKASGGYAFEEISLIRHKLAQAKCPYVCEHIEQVLEEEEKVVVFVHHRDVAAAIYERFAESHGAVLVYGGMDQEVVYRQKEKFWNDPSCKLFIGSVKMTGTGLNLQVAHHVIFAESDWVPGTLTQAEDRCHRIGQEDPVLIQHLVAQDSMDSYMMKKVVNKQKTIQQALNRKEKV